MLFWESITQTLQNIGACRRGSALCLPGMQKRATTRDCPYIALQLLAGASSLCVAQQKLTRTGHPRERTRK